MNSKQSSSGSSRRRLSKGALAVRAAVSRDPQQLLQISAEDRDFLGVAQEFRVQAEVHRHWPVERHVSAVDDLTDSHFRNQVSEPLLGEDHRVDNNLALEDLAGLARVRAIGVVANDAGRLGASEVGGQISARVSGTHFQSGELIEGSVEDQPREEVCRLERVADDVTEVAASPQRAVLDDVVGPARVHDHWNAELGSLGPERVVLWRREILAVDVAADGGAAKAEPLDAVLELLGRKIGVLQRNRRHRHETIRVSRHPLGQSFVLRANDAARALAIGRLIPPEPVDRQSLNIDARSIHELYTLRSQDLVAASPRAS